MIIFRMTIEIILDDTSCININICRPLDLFEFLIRSAFVFEYILQPNYHLLRGQLYQVYVAQKIKWLMGLQLVDIRA